MNDRFTADETRRWFLERLQFLGINQEQFGKRAGIAESEASRIINQKSRPRVEFLDRLADALEVSIVVLLIALGAIAADGKNTPKIIEGKKNSKTIWLLNK